MTPQGEVNYSYTLTSPVTNAGAVTEDYQVFMVDNVGNSTVGAGTLLKIAIEDDAPIATTDANNITENTTSITTTSATGVFANDTIGADGASTMPVGPVTGVAAGTASPSGNVDTNVTGAFGSINIAADGSYTYAVDNGNTTVDALNVGDSVTDTFTYQITDADGDAATATITVTINGVNDAPTATSDTTSTPTEDGPPVSVPLTGIDVDGKRNQCNNHFWPNSCARHINV